MIKNIFHIFSISLLMAISMPAFSQASNPPDWWVSISNDKVHAVKDMLAQGADPNEVSPGGQPGLMLAIREGAWGVYDLLLAHRATVINAINVNRETALMYLAVLGETKRAEDLIRRGALVNRPGWTPLHYAASMARMDTARMLLRHRANVNAVAADGTTPLMMAAYAGSESMLRLLLEHGADVHLKTRQDYDAADWAGFKAHTRVQGKLRQLIDGPGAAGQSAALAFDETATANGAAAPSKEQAPTSTSRYFDLERFEREDDGLP